MITDRNHKIGFFTRTDANMQEEKYDVGVAKDV